MGVPLLDLPAQYRELKEELDTAYFQTMESAGFIGGPKVKELEEQIAEYVGTKYAVACGNGTDALFLTLAALGIGKGDEVITTPFTFWATIEAIVDVGATPVFVDIEPGTYNMDVTQVKAVVTKNTKAIMPVHIFGQCVDMDPLWELVQGTKIKIVEDACQAIGATFQGDMAGSLGDAACFSFFPSKNLGCAGDGGMVTTDSQKLANAVRKLASHGTSKKYFHDAFGTNSRLDALQAAFLLVKLPHLDHWNKERRQAALHYNRHLGEAEGIRTPVFREYGDTVVHLYILMAETTALTEMITSGLKEAGIGSALYYPLPAHQQEALVVKAGYDQPSLPVAESCGGTTFAIPCFPGITRTQQDEVIEVLLSILS
jgi:dTDP-4-amino-4,6-dideoxygalactose transaminase